MIKFDHMIYMLLQKTLLRSHAVKHGHGYFVLLETGVVYCLNAKVALVEPTQKVIFIKL